MWSVPLTYMKIWHNSYTVFWYASMTCPDSILRKTLPWLREYIVYVNWQMEDSKFIWHVRYVHKQTYGRCIELKLFQNAPLIVAYYSFRMSYRACKTLTADSFQHARHLKTQKKIDYPPSFEVLYESFLYRVCCVFLLNDNKRGTNVGHQINSNFAALKLKII